MHTPERSTPRLFFAIGWFTKNGAARAAFVLEAGQLRRAAQVLACVAIGALSYCSM